MTPDLAFQTAVRAALIDPLDGKVEPTSIRAGSVRPSAFPAVVMAMPSVEIIGRAAIGQVVAEIDMLLHVWCHDNAAELAQGIGADILRSLMDAPDAGGIAFDEWQRPRLTWVADPAHEALHGAVALSCVARWRE